MAEAASPDVQYEKVNQPAFFTALREKSLAVLGALEGAGATAEGLAFDVDGVPVTLRIEGGDALVTVGENPRDPGKRHLYEWRAPAGWLAEATSK